MRARLLLAAFLLGVGLYFVPAAQGTEQIPVATKQEMKELRRLMCEGGAPSTMQYLLLETKVEYIMTNPTDFLLVYLAYDPRGDYFELAELAGGQERVAFVKGIGTKDKLIVIITDTRGASSRLSGEDVAEFFLSHLARLLRRAPVPSLDINRDIVAGFYDRGNRLLAYFYQGRYHLWEE